VLEVDPAFQLKSFNPPPVVGGRKPVRVSLGNHFRGAAMPVCDFRDPHTLLRGCRKRIGPVMPKADPQLLQELHDFNHMFMRKYFSDCIIDPTDDLSVDEWLDGTNYPLYRKDELKKQYHECDDLFNSKYEEVKVHGKDESYSKFGEARGIYSRSDIFKVLSGPVFAKIGKKFFTHKQFFKKVPHHLRIKVLKERLGKIGFAWDTDFTSFESTFQKAQLEYEFEFYRYCCHANPAALERMERIIRVLGGINICKSKYFKFNVNARRMSGEMNTSLGNSYFNLLLSVFIAVKSGNDIDEIMSSILVEGDDCICVSKIVPDSGMYEKFGAKVKQNFYSDPCHASFCGMIFDQEAEQIIVSPVEKILNLSYTNDEYLFSSPALYKDLLRAKALSMLYSYPGCPIISNCAASILKQTVGYDPTRILKTKLSEYERGKWIDILTTEVPYEEPKLKTRILMEEKFSIPIEFQLRLEKFFDEKNDLLPYDFPEMLDYCKEEYIRYYDIYSLHSKAKNVTDLGEQFI
jgi:hypothetical protein